MRCDQCRHWKEDKHAGWEYTHSGFRTCAAVRERWEVMDEATRERELGWADGEDGWNEWEGAPAPPNSWTGVRVAALKAARAVVQDGSEYMAELLTAPDFFCALFASGIEAPSGGETTEIGSTEGEIPTAEGGDAPNQPGEPNA